MDLDGFLKLGEGAIIKNFVMWVEISVHKSGSVWFFAPKTTSVTHLNQAISLVLLKNYQG